MSLKLKTVFVGVPDLQGSVPNKSGPERKGLVNQQQGHQHPRLTNADYDKKFQEVGNKGFFYCFDCDIGCVI